MSRIVRSSKFRHVFGTPAKNENCYTNIKISKGPWESNMCSVNSKFVAVVLESQGGGAFTVIPVDKVGRVDINYPKVCGHRSLVMDIAWNPFDENVIASCSEDCTVKLWNIPDGGLKENLDQPLISLQRHQRKVGHLHWHPTAENILASSGFDCVIIIWNVGTGEEVFRVSGIHPENILSFDWNYDGSLLATTCKDKRIRVIDPRRNEVVTEGQGHTGAKPSRVIFCGPTDKLFTTGFSRSSERQYGVWNSSNLSNGALTFENIDNGSGVLFPFWDEGTHMVYIVGKGDTQIKYFELVENPPYVHFLTMYQSGNSQRGAAVLPKRHINYMLCEVMRFFKLQNKGLVEPISMTVPRKSEMFQDDIYPPAYAGIPSMTAEEWISGMNKNPCTVSFTPDGLVYNKPPEAKKDAPKKGSLMKTPSAEPENMTPMQAKVHEYEKRSSSTELREPRSNSASVSPPPIITTTTGSSLVEPHTDAEYRKAYFTVKEENADLKLQIEELKKKLASLERRATYKRH